jgi:hypothetical protein
MHVAVKATTNRAAARGIIESFMLASLVEVVDISFGYRLLAFTFKARKARVI